MFSVTFQNESFATSGARENNSCALLANNRSRVERFIAVSQQQRLQLLWVAHAGHVHYYVGLTYAAPNTVTRTFRQNKCGQFLIGARRHCLALARHTSP